MSELVSSKDCLGIGVLFSISPAFYLAKTWTSLSLLLTGEDKESLKSLTLDSS